MSRTFVYTRHKRSENSKGVDPMEETLVDCNAIISSFAQTHMALQLNMKFFHKRMLFCLVWFIENKICRIFANIYNLQLDTGILN